MSKIVVKSVGLYSKYVKTKDEAVTTLEHLVTEWDPYHMTKEFSDDMSKAIKIIAKLDKLRKKIGILR